MAEWTQRSVEDLCSRVTSGGTPSRSKPEFYIGGTIPWVKTGELRDGYIFETEEHISQAAVDGSSAKILPVGTILMAMYGATVGALGMLAVEATCNQASCALIADPAVCDSRWLFYTLLNDRVRAISLATGAAQQNLNAGSIRRFTYEVPELPEQRAIAEVLGALDDKIAANIQLAKTSGQLGLALLGEARANDAVHPLISDVVKVLVRGVTPSYTESQEHSIVVLNQKCIRGQRVAMGPSRRTALNKVRSEKILIPGDVLVNSTGQGTLGRVARWTGAVETTVDSHLTIVRFDESQVDLTCAGYAMLELQPKIEELGEGSTGQTELSRVELGRLKLALPPLDRSRRIGADLAKMAEMEDSLLSENSTLAELRDTLLPELMSGRLRVKDAEKKIEEVV